MDFQLRRPYIITGSQFLFVNVFVKMCFSHDAKFPDHKESEVGQPAADEGPHDDAQLRGGLLLPHQLAGGRRVVRLDQAEAEHGPDEGLCNGSRWLLLLSPY